LAEYTRCANCGHKLNAHVNFCAECGQSARANDASFLSFIRQSTDELLDIDGRLAFTLRTLLFKPGLVSYEISQGKRAKYTPALRLYLALSVLFF
jgi:ribosomal protein L32